MPKRSPKQQPEPATENAQTPEEIEAALTETPAEPHEAHA